MITTKSPGVGNINDWFVIAIYTDSMRTRKIVTPSNYKTLYCDAKDIWSCRSQMMKYINAHLSDFVTSKDESIMTMISKGYFGKQYASPMRRNGKWVMVTDPYVPDSYPGKYRKVPSRPKNR